MEDKDTLRYWITVVIVTALISVFAGVLIGGLIESNQSRREIDGIREQLNRANGINTELAGELGQCQEITRELGNAINGDINTIRDCIETIEVLRTEIGNLENCCNNIDWDSYYNYWDAYYGIKQ